MKQLLARLQQTVHGFKHIVEAGDKLLKDGSRDHLQLAAGLLEEESYQARMLGAYLLGMLSAQNRAALQLLRTRVARDDNWRVQEMLAKAIDQYCRAIGYEQALPVIREWLDSDDPHVKRAMIEGLRIWTSRPYFKDHPETAISLISAHRADQSEYLRKSVGNALRDISKKHGALVEKELRHWNLKDPATAFTHKLVIKGQ